MTKEIEYCSRMTRTEKLLLSIANDLEDGRCAMNHEWLVENEVTADECCALADKMAALLRGWVQSPDRIQMTVLACSVMDSRAMGETVTHVMERNRVMERLGASRPNDPSSATTPRKP